MKSRNLPEVVKATFGAECSSTAKVLTAATLLREKHDTASQVLRSVARSIRAHPFLPVAPQNYYFESWSCHPDPYLSGGLGQQ